MKKILIFSIFLAVNICSFGQLNPLSIGTLDPGDSIMVYYDVTINACACSEIDNQGSVSGSNFATLVTDDPDTPAADDITRTLLNLFVVSVSDLHLYAKHSGSGIALSWTINTESDMIKYEVERSTDGNLFTRAGETASVNSSTGYTYGFYDALPNKGVNYYRLRLLSNSASPKYSSTVKVNAGEPSGSLEVYPNPVKQKQINMRLDNVEKGNYTVSLFDNLGRMVYSGALQHNGGPVSNSLLLPKTLTAGIYNLKLQGDKGVYTKALVIE